MKALKFNITLNTIKAFTAGCDLVLHCNGKIKEMTKVAENSKKLNKFIIEKTLKYYRLDMQLFHLRGWICFQICLLYTSPSPRDGLLSRMPSSA